MAFLKVVSLEKALEVVKSLKVNVGIESVTLESALGRVLAEDIISPIDVPPFDRATVDGYALCAEDTFMASESNPVELKVIGEVHAGDEKVPSLGSGEAVYVSTGAMIPKNSNAVVMFESVEREGDVIKLTKPLYPGEGVMKKGADIERGALLIRKGERLDFRKTALLSAIGIGSVKVFRRPSVAVISTGNEIVLPGEPLKPGKIYDINGRALTDALRWLGAKATFIGIAKDSEEDLERSLKRTLDHDLVLLSGGASGGFRDLTERVIGRFGKVLVHGIAIQPGKPTIIGVIDGKPVFGLPGYPTSCLINFTLLVLPLLSSFLGGIRLEEKRWAKLRHKVFSVKGRRQFLPVKFEGEEVVPILKGSGAVTSFVNADGFIEVPENVEILKAGEPVEVTLFPWKR